MDCKQPEKPQKPSSVNFIQENDEHFSPLPTSIRTKSLEDLLGTRSLDTFGSIPSTPPKNEQS